MLLIITLIAIGILLLAAELLIIPGFGVPGIVGLAALGYACYYAFTTMGVATGVFVLIVIILAIIISTWVILRSKTWRKISLTQNIEAKIDLNPEEKGLKLGARGVTMSRVSPMGKARFGSLDIEVVSQIGVIPSEAEVEIVNISENKIIIKQINI